MCVSVCFAERRKKKREKKEQNESPKNGRSKIFFLNFIIFEQNEAKFLLGSKKRDARFFSFLFFSLVYSSSAKKPPHQKEDHAYKNRHTRNITREREERSLLVDVFSPW